MLSGALTFQKDMISKALTPRSKRKSTSNQNSASKIMSQSSPQNKRSRVASDVSETKSETEVISQSSSSSQGGHPQANSVCYGTELWDCLPVVENSSDIRA